MISRTRCLFAVLVTCMAYCHARGQEGPPGSHPPGAPGAAPVSESEKKYVEMSHSKDRVLKATAERYLNLVKFQEWGGASGKTQMAKYVSHDPDLKQVKLSVAKGTGKDRVVKEFDGKTTRQQVILYLGDGESSLNPLDENARYKLAVEAI